MNSTVGFQASGASLKRVNLQVWSFQCLTFHYTVFNDFMAILTLTDVRLSAATLKHINSVDDLKHLSSRMGVNIARKPSLVAQVAMPRQVYGKHVITRRK